MKKISWRWLIPLIVILLGVTIILGVFIWYFHRQGISDSISDWASFGSYLGGTLSFISVVLMYLIFREQIRISYNSQFESVFFSMLKTLRELKTDGIDKEFGMLENKITNHFSVSFDDKNDNILPDTIRSIFSYYFNLHVDNSQIFHYFRYLYHIVTYAVDNKVLKKEDKKRYISLIQAQMSNNELLVTLFNVVSHNNQEYLKMLDVYQFFENLQSINKLVDNLIKRIFKGTEFKHFNNHSIPSVEEMDFGYENYDNEQFYLTLERINKVSNKAK